MKLGVNIDHIAVLREARRCNDPSPIDALLPSMLGGADQITIHLREDRRHIQDDDAKKIVELSRLPVNIECAVESSIIDIICDLRPQRATLVPEKRKEVTTEGGVDLIRTSDALKRATRRLKERGIAVSYFIDPCEDGVRLSKEYGADMVELHTGRYANLYLMLYSNLSRTHHSIKELDIDRTNLEVEIKKELGKLSECSKLAKSIGLDVAAGHGLNYQNVFDIAAIEEIEELNIGQSIVARSVFVGFERAVREMKELICKNRK
jgi:pyridoxine 5-phosphate synthase